MISLAGFKANAGIDFFRFILIFAVVAFFIYKKTKRRKTLVISAIYLLSGIIACILQLELVKFGLLFLGVLVSTNCLVVTNNDLKYSSRNYSPVVKTPKSTLTDEDANSIMEKLMENEGVKEIIETITSLMPDDSYDEEYDEEFEF